MLVQERIATHTLKRLRTERGLSQLALARRSGVQAPHISMIENGLRNPNRLTLQKLALALNCQPEDLISEGNNAA